MNQAHAPSPLAGVTGQRILTPRGIEHASLRFNAGLIDDGGGTAARGATWFDAGNLLVLPGIVDLHGDAFERAIMPRPRVTFPYDGALFDVDRQLLANGITTEFHGVTLSWEGGLRGEAYAERMFEALERMRHVMGARHYVHLRFETHHVGGVDTAQQWIRDGRVRFVALNDHLPGMARRLGDDRKLLQYADRAECDLDTFQDRIRQAMAAADSVADAMRELTACAQAAGLKVASHDDPDAATRRYYHQLGCGVAEFPLTREAAGVARDLGNSVVFGAPNVVRGGSHTNAPNATEMIRAGLCDILTSDYYYPAPLAAVMRLVNDGVLPLEQAWNLVSLNPARAAGLQDRGLLAPGLIADAIVVDDQVPGLPRVCAAIVGGELRYATRAFGDDHSQRMAA
ncbi:alpha-D-ribose 1-methylphosphonate 5-triphosphate diphosphatase [Achromobacter sp. UMC71]|uniref:alpha-D-ribose 1-methylphosphonate 5-triphosphate diphosphatase n=1 Tax=Achromobacter sp. UMC71 TaxID=1862320 RepID=UPI001602FC9C|nr:alpha-D-ribose 1-methylphosphonate 5-triphosphate diphosphatase [Achromobacter sp. UMC71]MBB1626090.1 alpha-D-ribose 1-methylphosphonate 5-triphosphate diphosphatase [Achromobacter sp. UMC71]